jgi:cytochrome c oxidase subunit 2
MSWTRRIPTAALSAVLAGATASVLGAGSAVAQDLARGQELFQLCSSCHGPEAAGNEALQAPAIGGLPAWYVDAQLVKFQKGIRGENPEDHAGLRMGPMSRWLKTDEDTGDVAAYVASLPPPLPAPTLSGGDATQGAQLYAPCTACHGPDGGGNQALNAPPIRQLNDWYLLAQLEKFKAGIRGANPADTTGALMRPMAMTLVDEQAMKNVIAYIMTFSH